MDQQQIGEGHVTSKANNDNSNENENECQDLINTGTTSSVSSNSIDFVRCQLSDNDVQSLMANLLGKDTTSLSILDLSENIMHDMGAIAVANFLEVNRTLLAVNLSNNLISDNGAIAIAKALSINSVVRRLDLSNNDFGLEGLQALVEALKGNTTIEELFVWDNKRWSPKFERLEMKIHHFLLLNRAGRRVLLNGPLNLIPYVLEKVNKKPNSLFGLLVELPHLWKGASNDDF